MIDFQARCRVCQEAAVAAGSPGGRERQQPFRWRAPAYLYGTGIAARVRPHLLAFVCVPAATSFAQLFTLFWLGTCYLFAGDACLRTVVYCERRRVQSCTLAPDSLDSIAGDRLNARPVAAGLKL